MNLTFSSSCKEFVFSLCNLVAKFQLINCRNDLRASYIFNSGIVSVEDADHVLFIGGNPRLDAPVLNARVRKW